MGLSINKLVSETAQARQRNLAPKLRRQLEQISQQPRAKQQFIIETLDTVLQQAD